MTKPKHTSNTTTLHNASPSIRCSALTDSNSSKLITAIWKTSIRSDDCTITDSTIREGSWRPRCEVSGSAIGRTSALRPSTVVNCRVTGSRLKKADLVDCDVEDYVIVNTDLKGVMVKNGI
ncbi:uncharacterized protein BP01DRAFT_392982 [Aspergillus saccharolyticus JOP 1030-1]|uniref:Uncharacterized protein n=1 Tax=Aspergillus saccharolyticus JOP 1030-1 TaxID=1450539 RepID=A0A318ZC39_9EURO|nr:hypothetical protein BP01DRAFT_392982 [Aspergillus saccharolyticus JOP 1030-1]PYH43884.1 hypothetical protein BP01DRAFT_392982 [Aspergillus saccharolyticus JOP 1030-1]